MNKIAIVERLSEKKGNEPFRVTYVLDVFYKEIFDRLNILLIPVVSDKGLEEICKICDGLILTGSNNDTYPKYYDEEILEGKEYNKFDEYPISARLIHLFSKENKPILGICAGLQEINVAFGGSLNQRIPNHYLKTGNHMIKLEKDSFLYDTYKKEEIEINSYHRQCIKKCAENFKVTATSDDGIIEGIEKGNIIGVQWHPEALNDMEFFNNFVSKFIIK